MIDNWIAEATECDFKVALEVKKPKSWLKSVSAFANGIGGTLLFGIDDNRNVIGLADAQADAEAISRLIKERISPYPNFILVPERENGKDILILTVSSGHTTPYYYKADGVMEAYIRIGNESVIAPSFVLNQLILKGMNRTYDILISEYNFKDYAFSKLRERYKVWTGNSMEDKLFDSFDIRNEHGKLTNAGALLADDSPIRHSRLFCTRWNGLDKSGGMADGTKIQERDISNISSTRRNPVLADIFGRLGYMERQGSGFKKITESYHAAHNYREELEPKFYSDVTSFKVTLYNLNYGTITTSDNISIEDGNIAVTTDHVAIEVAIDGLNASQSTIKKVKAVYKSMGIDGIFGRSDISSITGDSVTAAGNLINKLKTANLIVPVKGYGKGKYRFIELHK